MPIHLRDRLDTLSAGLERSRALQYLLAISAVALAAGLRALVEPLISNRSPYQVFLLAVAVVGLACDLYPTLLAVLLGGAVGDYFFSEPRFSLAETPLGWWLLAIYVGCSAILTFATQAHRRSSRRLRGTVAEMKRTEAALRQSQERLQLAQRAADMGAWEWNIRSGEVVWSDETCRLHGLAPGGFAGRYQAWLDTVHPDDWHIVEAAIRAALERRAAYTVEYRTVLPTGDLRWTSARGQVICDDAGQPQRVVGVCMDVTERKLSEDALRRQAALLDLTADAVFIWELDAGITYWNRGAEALYGYPAAEAVGRVTQELLHTSFPMPWPEFRAQLLRQQAITCEITHVARDGRILVVESRHQLIRGHEGRRLVLETCRDISDRKSSEEKLRRAEGMLAAAHMASALAHEINNPWPPPSISGTSSAPIPCFPHPRARTPDSSTTS